VEGSCNWFNTSAGSVVPATASNWAAQGPSAPVEHVAFEQKQTPGPRTHEKKIGDMQVSKAWQSVLAEPVRQAQTWSPPAREPRQLLHVVGPPVQLNRAGRDVSEHIGAPPAPPAS
jgi:hypothetical protein